MVDIKLRQLTLYYFALSLNTYLGVDPTNIIVDVLVIKLLATLDHQDLTDVKNCFWVFASTAPDHLQT